MSSPLYLREKNPVRINWEVLWVPEPASTLWKRETFLLASDPTTFLPGSSPLPKQPTDSAKRSDPTKLWEISDRKTGLHQASWSISTFSTTYAIVQSLSSQPSNHRKWHNFAKHSAKFQCVEFPVLSLALLAWISCPDCIETKVHCVKATHPHKSCVRKLNCKGPFLLILSSSLLRITLVLNFT
jgi:hypothetical protein